MSRPKNEVIGEVDCPMKGCSEVCKVYRFRQRGTGHIRFAGKLYADCPVHGRIGADGKAGTNEYILENATIWGDVKRPVNLGPAPEPNEITPATVVPDRPVPSPEQPPVTFSEKPKRRWWDELTTILK